MKRIFFALVVGLISTLAATNRASAQNTANVEGLEPQKNLNAVDKSGAVNDNMAAISPKALQAFAKAYKNVTGGSWEATREGSAVKFTSGNVSTMIYYNTKGTWAGSLKGYNEENMPADVRKNVKREYYDFRITYVQEVQTTASEGQPTYVIHLEDSNSIKLVRVHDGEMEVWKSYKKQS